MDIFFSIRLENHIFIIDCRDNKRQTSNESFRKDIQNLLWILGLR